MTDQRTLILQEWLQAKENADKWVARERKLRDFIAERQFGYTQVAGGLVGTHRADIGNGYQLKLVTQVQYILKDSTELREALEYSRRLAVPLPKPLVKWEPKLSISAYNAADSQLKKLIEPALTTKPQAPQLEIEPPK